MQEYFGNSKLHEIVQFFLCSKGYVECKIYQHNPFNNHSREI